VGARTAGVVDRPADAEAAARAHRLRAAPAPPSGRVSADRSASDRVSADPPLAPDEYARYARQLVLPGVGEAGQRRLRRARVLVVGAGGLGSSAALHLAAAGVGTLGLVDDDRVDASNLHRQLLYGAASLGRPKLDAAAERLGDLNAHVRVVAHPTRLTAANARALAADYELVVDGTDNFAARYAVNDACVALGVPNVYGSVHRFEGQVSVFAAPGGPCYRCLHPAPPPDGMVPDCATGGVLGVLPGLVGTLQATEALKHLLGVGEPLVGRLLVVDALSMRFLRVAVAPRPGLPGVRRRGARRPVPPAPPRARRGRPAPTRGRRRSPPPSCPPPSPATRRRSSSTCASRTSGRPATSSAPATSRSAPSTRPPRPRSTRRARRHRVRGRRAQRRRRPPPPRVRPHRRPQPRRRDGRVAAAGRRARRRRLERNSTGYSDRMETGSEVDADHVTCHRKFDAFILSILSSCPMLFGAVPRAILSPAPRTAR
jgi:adenylyltransferase/sulfurtransferase